MADKEQRVHIVRRQAGFYVIAPKHPKGIGHGMHSIPFSSCPSEPTTNETDDKPETKYDDARLCCLLITMDDLDRTMKERAMENCNSIAVTYYQFERHLCASRTLQGRFVYGVHSLPPNMVLDQNVDLVWPVARRCDPVLVPVHEEVIHQPEEIEEVCLGWEKPKEFLLLIGDAALGLIGELPLGWDPRAPKELPTEFELMEKDKMESRKRKDAADSV